MARGEVGIVVVRGGEGGGEGGQVGVEGEGGVVEDGVTGFMK